MSADRVILFRLATSTRLEHAARAAPLGQRLAWRAASRYVAGTTAAAAAQVARELRDRGVGSSIDQFGELVQDTATAERVAASYLGLDVDPPGCAERLAAIAARLSAGRRIQVGAEDLSRAEAVLTCIENVARQGLADRLGATAEANFRRTPRDLERLVEAGVYIRLVKGAYVEPHDSALPYGEPTDIAYLRLAHRLAETQAQFALATHDGVLREALLAALGPRPVEQLLGVRPATLDELVARGIPVRVYVPFGNDWFRYWMRRLAESRGA